VFFGRLRRDEYNELVVGYVGDGRVWTSERTTLTWMMSCEEERPSNQKLQIQRQTIPQQDQIKSKCTASASALDDVVFAVLTAYSPKRE